MKRILLVTLQVAVTLLALWLLFGKAEQRAEMAAVLRTADWTWIALGTAIGSLTYVVGALRCGLLRGALGIVLPWTRVAGVFFVGLFFNLFGLGATGGDVVKVLYIVREAPDRKLAAGFTVLMDRVVGLLALILMAGVFVGLRYDWLTRRSETAVLVGVMGGVLGASLAVMTLAAVLAATGWERGLPMRLPGRAAVLEMVEVFRQFGRRPAELAGAFAMSFVAHGALFATFWAAARAVRVPVPFYDIAAIMPIVNTIIALPFSVGGVGVREGLFKQLLGDLCGVPAAEAKTISILGFLIGVFFCAIGGAVYLFFRRAGAPAPARVEA